MPPGRTEQDNGEFGPLNLLIVLLKHKWLLIGLPLGAGVLVALATLLIPNSYQASAKLLPPQQSQSGASALLAQLGSAAGLAAGASGIKSPSDMYVGILRSRTVADKIIAKHGLKKAFDTESGDAARGQLEEQTIINAGKDGLIVIAFEDEDKKLVASIANAYVEELQALTKILAITEASQRRLFFERQLEISKDKLAAAEGALKQALDTRGVINVDSETRAMAEIVGRVRAQVSAKEIQISAMKAFVTPSNQEYKLGQEELKSLRAELSRLENGRPGNTESADGAGATKAGLENIKVLREVKYHQMLYEFLAKQYEAARLDEAKDVAIIQVLDTAVEPEHQFKPRRSMYTIFAALLALFAAVVIAVAIEAKRKAMHSAQFAAQWGRLQNHLSLGKAR